MDILKAEIARKRKLLEEKNILVRRTRYSPECPLCYLYKTAICFYFFHTDKQNFATNLNTFNELLLLKMRTSY